MEFRIEEKDAFKIIGHKIETTNEKQRGYKQISKFWQKTMGNKKKSEQLLGKMNAAPFGVIGVNVYNTDEQDSQKFDYYIGVSTTEEDETLESYTVDAQTWAIFPCTMETLAQTEVDIVLKWQPGSDYELLNTGYETGEMQGMAPDLEVYGQGTDAEVWVAVKKKA